MLLLNSILTESSLLRAISNWRVALRSLAPRLTDKTLTHAKTVTTYNRRMHSSSFATPGYPDQRNAVVPEQPGPYQRSWAASPGSLNRS